MLTATAYLAQAANGFVFAASDDGDAGNLALLFLLSGFVFYGYVFLRYRNADKRHRHEKETEADMHNVQVGDRFIRTRTGLRNSKMTDANNRSVRGYLNKPLGGVDCSVQTFMRYLDVA